MPDGLHSHDSKPLAFERFRTAKESIKVQLFVLLSDAGIARVIRNFLITRTPFQFASNPVEFDGIRMQAGMNSFSLTAHSNLARLEKGDK